MIVSFRRDKEQRIHDHRDLLLAIDKAQPMPDQLGSEFIQAVEYRTEEILLNDMVWIYDEFWECIKQWLVAGFLVEPEDGKRYLYAQTDHGRIVLDEQSYRLKRLVF